MHWKQWLQASMAQPAVNVTAANQSVSVSNDQTKFTVEINPTKRRENVIIPGLPEPNLSILKLKTRQLM